MWRCNAKLAAGIVLLAVNVLTLEDINIAVNKGSDFIAFIDTKERDVAHCSLTTPNGKIIDFDPEERGTRDNKYELNFNAVTKCLVIIKEVDEHDNGDWVLKYDYAVDKVDEQVFRVTVKTDTDTQYFTRVIQYETAQRINTSLGATHMISINSASFTTNQACFLVTPSGVTHTLTATTVIPGVQVITGNNIECGVTITVRLDTIGEWTLFSWTMFLFQEMERRLPFTIRVEGMVREQDTGKSILQQINHVTQAGAYFDISLSKTDEQEECFLTTPDEITESLSSVTVSGVTVQSSSSFVNCRVTIGPMEQKMLGIWTLCGRSGEHSERCQPANVTWYTDTQYFTRVIQYETAQRINTSLGATHTISINSASFTTNQACFLVTPSGVTHTLTATTVIPGVQVITGNNIECGVTITVRLDTIGEWTLFSWTMFLFQEMERRLPFTIQVEGMVREQDTGKRILQQINHVTQAGAYFDISLSKTDEQEECFLTTPDEITESLSSVTVSGVTVQSSSSFVNCRVTIGPMEQKMLGIWTLCGRSGEHSERCQPANVTWYTDTQYFTRVIQYETAQRFNTDLGATHTISINSASFTTNQACFLVTPSGVTYNLTATTVIPGVQVITGNNIECGVTITVSRDAIGEWTLFSWTMFLFQEMERRLPFTIQVEGMVIEQDTGKRILQQINHVTRAGAYFDISLSKTDEQEECFLTTPDEITESLSSVTAAGVTVQSSSSFVNCRVTIGPMEQKMLGIWTLCGRGGEHSERCQPANVTWYSSTNPSLDWELNPEPQFDYVVHFGGISSPSISGLGEVLTCHIVTPAEEDIALTGDTDYLGLQRTALDSISVCRVNIGPIDVSMLGDWVIYAKFHSPFFGFSETRMPFTFNLYNEDDPYAQAYNVTRLNPVNRVVNIGNTITAEVTGTGSIDNCYYVTPSGEIYSSSDTKSDQGVIFEDVGGRIACRVTIGPITETMLGQWKIIGKFNLTEIFNEIRQPLNIIKEDPENPIIDEDRRIDILTPQTLNSELGARHTITIPLYSFTTVDSCHIRTPQGLQYKLIEGFNLPGITIIESSNTACGISFTIENENMLGEWTLISRATVISQPVEQRLSFTVYVEEIVEAFPSEVTITEGNDLYVRLREPANRPDTCRILGPNENIVPAVDTVHESTCGFIVRSIDLSSSGEWEIAYGNGILYKAHINVTVVEKPDINIDDLLLYEHSSVNQTIGPENLVYCRLRNPKGITVFEGFGRCRLAINRVSSEHEGRWVIAAGTPGHIVVEEYNFLVIVINEDDKPVVITHVEKQRPEVIISCKLSSEDTVQTCKFRDPSGAILLASQGVGQDRYIFHGTEVGLESELVSNECALRITNPTTADLGLWRCAMETESKTYFGFLPVLCPWALNNPDVQAVVTTEPILTANRELVVAVEGDSVIMSCSIQAPIRYCYFRRQNGTTFSVGPATSTAAMQYVGAGFEAGECGVRFNNLVADDSGSWSCHVGLHSNEPEQRAQFDVIVEPSMIVRLGYNVNNELLAEANISMPGTLEYCRFIRMDGVGFTSENVLEGYKFIGSLQDKYCAIKMAMPTILNLHPWAIAAKLVGMDVEIVRTTTENLLTVPGNQDDNSDQVRIVFLWIIISLLTMLILVLILIFVPKIDKTWVKQRMNSFRKKPVDNYTA